VIEETIRLPADLRAAIQRSRRTAEALVEERRPPLIRAALHFLCLFVLFSARDP